MRPVIEGSIGQRLEDESDPLRPAAASGIALNSRSPRMQRLLEDSDPRSKETKSTHARTIARLIHRWGLVEGRETRPVLAAAAIKAPLLPPRQGRGWTRLRGDW